MKAQKKIILPVNINLPERVVFADGTMFVVLRTLDELVRFYRDHKGKLEFACEGKYWGEEPSFLREYEWVFGPSKASVVRRVMRWDQSGVSCEFFDWSKSDPASWAGWFDDREQDRASQIKKGLWSDKDEADYVRKTPDTYRGWWELKNLPDGYSDLPDPLGEHDELFDPNTPIGEVEKVLQEQAFDDLMGPVEGELVCHDVASIEETISYWTQQKTEGSGYYGEENEVVVAP